MYQLGSLFAVDPNTSNVSEKPSPHVLLVVVVKCSNPVPSGLNRKAACANWKCLPLTSPLKPEYPTTPQMKLSGPNCRFEATAWVSVIPQPVLNTCRTSALSSPLVSLRKRMFGGALTI